MRKVASLGTGRYVDVPRNLPKRLAGDVQPYLRGCLNFIVS